MKRRDLLKFFGAVTGSAAIGGTSRAGANYAGQSLANSKLPPGVEVSVKKSDGVLLWSLIFSGLGAFLFRDLLVGRKPKYPPLDPEGPK